MTSERSDTPWQPPDRGALDDTQWPDRLVAKAIEPGIPDRLHGYAVVGDLARHYRFSDVLYLAITGELPDERASALFHLALCGFATPSVGEAPSHIGVVSRICGGSFASALGAGLVALAEQARHAIGSHAALLAWLEAPTEALPAELTSEQVSDHEWVRVLQRAAAASGIETAAVRPGMTRDAARIALLFEAGIRKPEQLEASLVVSQTCGVVAETLLATPRDLAAYPVTLPPFHYVEGP